MTQVVDTLGRPLRDLRISVTDRCNFRCVYCMPAEVFGRNYPFLPRAEILTFEEIARLARAFSHLGVRKVRLTGGEPLLRRDLERCVGLLASIDGIDDLTLTTNGAVLTREKAVTLRRAGLKRITISLDSLDDAVFKKMNGVDIPVAHVLAAIDAAAAAGLAPVKIDVVVRRGLNDDGVIAIAEYFRGRDEIVRFIEYMDVGNSNGWSPEDVVPSSELRQRIAERWDIEPLEPTSYGEVAERYRYSDGQGEIGFISSVTRPFCASCTRLRLAANGTLYTCLFASSGHDLRPLVRGGATDEELIAKIAELWQARGDRYSELRFATAAEVPKVEMSHIGG